VGVLADRLGAMRIRVTTAHGAVVGELYGRDRVRVSFGPDVYDRCEERWLERELEHLAGRLWVARTREYYAAVSAALGQTVTREAAPVTPRDREFRAARDRVEAVGVSPDGQVRVSLLGLRSWRIRIADDTRRTHTEEQFAKLLGEVGGELIRDQREKVRELKWRIYG
jgi:hypothetical protein